MNFDTHLVSLGHISDRRRGANILKQTSPYQLDGFAMSQNKLVNYGEKHILWDEMRF